MSENSYGCKIVLPEIFNLELTLNCGQAFRWEEKDGFMHGVIGGRAYSLRQEGGFLFCSCGESEFDSVLRGYFDLDRDYKAITESFGSDEYLKKATSEFSGIRILRQEKWETLCSFIISQNNNIPRIKGIIGRLCENFGEGIGGGDFTFPSADALARLSEKDLAPLRAGFRAKYVLDAARKVSSGEIKLEEIGSQPIDFGRKELMKIKGVGPKVAECTLLYGFGKTEAFPVDVWVKRILAEMYPNGLPECVKGNEGIAQQYLFHWRRNSPLFRDEK